MSDIFSPRPPVEGRASNQAPIMSVQGFLAALSLTVVGLRIWVRRTILRTFGWDDWFIVLSALFSIAVLACFIGLILSGGGHHIEDIGMPEEWEAIQHWEHILIVVNVTGASVVKISLSLALMRFLQERWHQLFLKSVIVFIIVYTIATETPLIFRCWPTYYIWAIEQPPGVCIPIDQFLIVANINAALNIVTDAILVFLPIPTMITLNVSLRTKASLVGVLFLGFIATAAAIVRAVMTNIGGPESDAWSLAFYIWNSVELNLGIVGASLPTLRPLFSGWLESATNRFRSGESFRSGDAATASAGSGNGSHNNKRMSRVIVVSKHGYRRQREQEAAGFAMELELGARDWTEGGNRSAPVISSSRTTYGLEANSSEEQILASPHGAGGDLGGITKHTEIAVQRLDV